MYHSRRINVPKLDPIYIHLFSTFLDNSLNFGGRFPRLFFNPFLEHFFFILTKRLINVSDVKKSFRAQLNYWLNVYECFPSPNNVQVF